MSSDFFCYNQLTQARSLYRQSLLFPLGLYRMQSFFQDVKVYSFFMNEKLINVFIYFGSASCDCAVG